MKIAMIGHKVVPSTRGGIETVLTNLCPIMAEKGEQGWFAITEPPTAAKKGV